MPKGRSLAPTSSSTMTAANSLRSDSKSTSALHAATAEIDRDTHLLKNHSVFHQPEAGVRQQYQQHPVMAVSCASHTHLVRAGMDMGWHSMTILEQSSRAPLNLLALNDILLQEEYAHGFDGTITSAELMPEEQPEQHATSESGSR